MSRVTSAGVVVAGRDCDFRFDPRGVSRPNQAPRRPTRGRYDRGVADIPRDIPPYAFTADWQREHSSASLLDFVAYLDLFQEAGGDLQADKSRDVETDGVQLMTVYQAKGLEYEVVVVPRLVEGQFPDSREEALLIPTELLRQRPPDESAIADERRLCFVRPCA